MSEREGTEGLRALHADLISLSNAQLAHVDRLWLELEARLDEFRKLLDRPPKSELSRKSLKSGKIAIDDTEYSVNDDFQENAIQLSEALALDEIAAAKLVLEAQAEDTPGESLLASAISNFHQQRNWLLECLRLLCTAPQDPDLPEELQVPMREFLGNILDLSGNAHRSGSLFVRKCLDAMTDIDRWLAAVSERLQANSALGQPSFEVEDVMNLQQQSLEQQHESLAAIVVHLIRQKYSLAEDFYKVLDILPRYEKWSSSVLHYVPILAALTAEHGSPEGSGTLREARMLDKKIKDGRNSTPWALRNLQAALVTWWLAEYSGWYNDSSLGSPLQGVDLEAEALERSELFRSALADGALQCTLAICTQISPYHWLDPTRSGLIQFLLQDFNLLSGESSAVSQYMQVMIFEQFEGFADAFVSNMPDTLRRFRADEDSQRKRFLSNYQAESSNGTAVQDLHLERFLIIIAFCYDNTRLDAARAFWEDIESNLYGFLQWASRRQSTPTVGAFCEMLRSISKGDEWATAAHRFLLEEGAPTSAKIRRPASLSWAQIFAELALFAFKTRDAPKPSQVNGSFRMSVPEDELHEPESALMLENYLRLMAHIVAESSTARSWILTQQDLNVLDALFRLCSGPAPSRLQACALRVVKALLTSKSEDFGKDIWVLFDQWVFGQSNFHDMTAPAKIASPSVWMMDASFTISAEHFEYLNEYCGLLHALVEPGSNNTGLNDQLAFPEAIGSSYRRPGIQPYIDFILGKVFTSIAKGIDSKLQQRTISWQILSFIVISLATFNDNLVVLGNRTAALVDEAMKTTSLSSYVQLHPFARVMEWLFNDRVISALFYASHQSIGEVSSASPDSPLSLSLIRAIETMNLIMDLQSTYQDLVRPAIKLKGNGTGPSIINPSLTSFEDSVSLHLDLIADLGLYAGLGDQELASASLQLLEKLASSRKLNVQASLGTYHGNRLIGVLEHRGRLSEITPPLILALNFDGRELEEGLESPSWKIKQAILDFLHRTLLACKDRPSIAHALMGYSCIGNKVNIQPDGDFASGTSLFHAVVELVEGYPDGEGANVFAWAVSLQQKALSILETLWSSPLTAAITLLELRSRGFLATVFQIQRPLDAGTLFDGRSIRDPEFTCFESADALISSVSVRTSSLQYAAVEWRSLLVEGKASVKGQALSTFLGSAILADGSAVQQATVFDLLDFFEMDISSVIPLPETIFFPGLDFEAAVEGSSDHFGKVYNTRLVDEMVKLRSNECGRNNPDANQADVARLDQDAAQIILHFLSRNNQQRVATVRYQALDVWADLVILVMKTCDLDASSKLSLILQIFQLVVSKLEYLVSTNAPEAAITAKLIQSLICEVDITSPSLNQATAGSAAVDRLFQVFRTALRAIGSPGLSSPLRETLYRICHQYLSTSASTSLDSTTHRHKLDTVKHAGSKVLEAICDDAYGAPASCRISALMLLDSLATLAADHQSEYLLIHLIRTNFLQILVETIEDIPHELRSCSAHDIPTLLTVYEWKFSLLLTIATEKKGGAALINTGILNAVRVSGLFSVDPDIGIEIDNPEALAEYYKLLLAITKIVVALIVAHGPQNEHVKALGRGFLAGGRPLVVAAFKREARIGGVSFDDAGVSIEELVELFVVLISLTDFLEFEEHNNTQKGRRMGFT